MRLPFLHRRDEASAAPCPRCNVTVPTDEVQCIACGWDLRDAYRPPAGSADLDPQTTARRDRGDSRVG
jgi:hypothetical protein